MPGLEGRFNTLVKAKVSAVLDRAEDPGETLDYSYEKQLELLQQAKSGIVDVVTSKKRLQLQEGTLREQAAKLDGQARQALAAGNEDLSRQALTRKQAIEDELGSLDQQVADLEHQQQQLTDNENKLQAKVEAFRTKKEVIKAQYSAADAQVQISEAATGVGEQMADVGPSLRLPPGCKKRSRTPSAAAPACARPGRSGSAGPAIEKDERGSSHTQQVSAPSRLVLLSRRAACSRPARRTPSNQARRSRRRCRFNPAE
jgi:phage shock protein A